jgi:Na+/H+-dicarboxylate symporter/ABC-type amino acid transport substrate-binding protein
MQGGARSVSGRDKIEVLRQVLRIVTHPATIIAGVVSGLLFGFYLPKPAHALVPFAKLYVALLSMSMLPILVTALTWGIGQMLRNATTRALFPRMVLSYLLLLLLIPSAATVLVCVGLSPGKSLGEGAAAALGQQLASEPTVETGSPIMAFLQGMVPPNIFAALSGAQFISIVFFCVLLGLALGVVKSAGADDTLRVLNALNEAFATIFHWVLIPLPLGLFALGAAHVAEADRELLVALVRYVGYFYLAGLVAVAGLTAVLSIVCRKAPWRVLSDLSQPLVIAFATDNPLAALYSAIEVLQERFGVDRSVVDTVTPFGVLANQHGQVLLLTFTVLFLAQVFGVSLGTAAIVIVAGSCLISGAAAVGGGPALVPILAPILGRQHHYRQRVGDLRPWRIWVMGALLALAILPPAPSAAAAFSSFPDIRQVQERGALRVGLVAKDIPPLLVTGSDGQPAGIEIAMANGLARRLGVKLQFVRTAATHDELVAQVAAGEVDVAVSSVTRTVERAKAVRFSRPYLTQSVAVALNRVRALQENVACPDTPADAAALAARPGGLGVTRGGAYEQALRNQDKKINPVVFDTERELQEALETDRLLAGLGGEIELRQLFARHPAARINLKLCLVGEQKDQIAIAVRPDAPNLAAWIDVVLDNVGLQLKPSGIFTLGTDWTF